MKSKTLDSLSDTEKLGLLASYKAQRTMPIERLLAAFGITGTRDAASERVNHLRDTLGARAIAYFR